MGTIAFEDLSPGTVIDLGEVKVDREEMLAFSHRFDPQPFHLDEEAAERSALGRLCASGWFTACLWMRAYCPVTCRGCGWRFAARADTAAVLASAWWRSSAPRTATGSA